MTNNGVRIPEEEALRPKAEALTLEKEGTSSFERHRGEMKFLPAKHPHGSSTWLRFTPFTIEHPHEPLYSAKSRVHHPN